MTENRDMSHAACLNDQLQIALDVGSWMPNLPCSWCIRLQASGLTRPMQFSARELDLSYATVLLSLVFKPMACRVLKVKRFSCSMLGSLSQCRITSPYFLDTKTGAHLLAELTLTYLNGNTIQPYHKYIYTKVYTNNK